MPVLEITPEMIGPNRTRLALAYFDGIMLWPHDQAQRAEAMKSSIATFIKTAIDAAVPPMNLMIERDWYALAQEALPMRLVSDQSKTAFRHGVLAGELLAAAVNEHTASGSVKLESLKTEMTSAKRRKSHKTLDISRSTLENTIWPRYKPVSHLWAAYVQTALFERDPTFPCRLDSLPDFLALADSFCRAGLSLRLSRRNEALLSIDQLWTLPPWLVLHARDAIDVDK
jgi:hypothetical protein